MTYATPILYYFLGMLCTSIVAEMLLVEYTQALQEVKELLVELRDELRNHPN